jgi:hypothetical protein
MTENIQSVSIVFLHFNVRTVSLHRHELEKEKGERVRPNERVEHEWMDRTQANMMIPNTLYAFEMPCTTDGDKANLVNIPVSTPGVSARKDAK